MAMAMVTVVMVMAIITITTRTLLQLSAGLAINLRAYLVGFKYPAGMLLVLMAGL